MFLFKKEGREGEKGLIFKKTKQSGFIKVILIIVLALIILGYFGLDAREIMEKPLVQKNLNYVWNFVTFVWSHYFKAPAIYVWNEIWIDLIWNNFKSIFGK